MKFGEAINQNVIILITLSLIIIFSYLYNYTEGLVAYIKNGEVVYCKEYHSSGSDDDLVINGALLLFLIPVIIKLIRIKKALNIFELIIFLIFWIAQLIFLIIGIEIGNFYLTVFKDGNIILLAWVIFYFLSLICILTFFLINIFNKFKIVN